jgi:hypothetical protein
MKPLTQADRNRTNLSYSSRKITPCSALAQTTSARPVTYEEAINSDEYKAALHNAAVAAKTSVYQVAGLCWPNDSAANPEIEVTAKEAANAARRQVDDEYKARHL